MFRHSGGSRRPTEEDPPTPWRTILFSLGYAIISWAFVEFNNYLSIRIPIPVTISAIYFSLGSVLLVAFGWWVPPQKPELAHFVLLLGAAVATCLVVIASSTSERYDAVHEPVTEMISSSAPLLTLGWALLLRMERVSAVLVWSVILAGGGLMSFLYRESKLGATSIFLAFFCSLFSSLRYVLCQRVLQSPNGLFRPPTAQERRAPPAPPLPPMSALYYYFPMCTLILVPSAVVAELVDSVDFVRNGDSLLLSLVLAALGSILALFFSIMQFNVIQATSAITTGMITELRSPVVVEFTIMVAVHKRLRIEKWIGFFVSLVGFAMYMRYRWSMRKIIHDLSRDVYGGYNVVGRIDEEEDGELGLSAARGNAASDNRWDGDGFFRSSGRVISDDEDNTRIQMDEAPASPKSSPSLKRSPQQDSSIEKAKEEEAMERMANALAVSAAHSINATSGEEKSGQSDRPVMPGGNSEGVVGGHVPVNLPNQTASFGRTEPSYPTFDFMKQPMNNMNTNVKKSYVNRRGIKFN